MAVNKPRQSIEQYLLTFAEEVYRKFERPERARCESAVTLRRQLRARDNSDLLGGFIYDIPGIWVGDGPEQMRMANMHTFPLVKKIIGANEAAMVQARVECTIEPRSHGPNKIGIASIARGIYKYINNHPDYWSNNLETQIAQQCQTDPGYFIHTYQDPDGESSIKIKVDQYSDQPLEQPGEYACADCGASGPLFSEQMGRANTDTGRMPCLQCEGNAVIMSEPQFPEVPEFQGTTEYPAGNICQDVVSAFQIRIDERNTKNGKIRKARWLEHHFLMEEDDLQALVPYFDIGSPTEWSYPLKWEYQLETGIDLNLNRPWQDSSSQNPLHEVRRIYMRPAQYRHYRAPSDFTLDRGDGRAAMRRDGETPMLMIKAGESLIKYFPHGFWYIVSAERLLPIIEPCDLRDEWAYGTFFNDSASFWGQPLNELKGLQNTANNLFTIDIQHRESGSIATLLFDREWWDPESFERGLSPTREGTMIEKGDPLTNHFAQVTPPQMNTAMEGVGFIRSISQDIVGGQPIAIGAVAGSDQPYAAQRLQKEQSQGLLAPSQQSKAECKSQVVLQHLKHWQRHKPLEWFQYVGTIYGEEWKEQDIDAFINADLEMELEVWYKQGSEVPSSLIDQELKLRQFLLDLAQVAKATGNADLIKPELISKLAVSANVDYDIENVVADQRLAESRYQKIKQRLKENKGIGLPMEMLVELVTYGQDLKPTPREEHEVAIEFFQDQITALLAADEPDFPLVSSLLEMISRHEKAETDFAQTKNSQQVEGHAPEIAAQVAAAKAQAEGEAASAQQAAQAKQQEQAMKLQAKAEMDAEKQRHQSQENALDREHEAQKHEADTALKAAEISANVNGGEEAPAQDEPSLMHKVSESIAYKDAPISTRQQMEIQAGMKPSSVKEHERVHPEIVKQKIAASRPKPNGASK